MPSSVLPDEQEIDRIVLRPGSHAERIGGDGRLYLAAGYALLMQVAHPTVGAGVAEHSSFERDPWGRLLRTMDYLYLISRPNREAAAVGRRVRELHKSIKGTKPDGSRYHALEPEAYAWVHATLIEATVRAYRQFVAPMSESDAADFYAQYMPLGRLLGVRERDLPPDWAGFRDYFETMCSERLQRTETVDRVVATLDAREPPPVPVVRSLWPLLRLAPARAVRVSTVGLLTPELRTRLGLPWERRDARDFRRMGRLSRAATPILPRRLLDIGPRHLRWRADEIAAGPLGPGADRPAGAGRSGGPRMSRPAGAQPAAR